MKAASKDFLSARYVRGDVSRRALSGIGPEAVSPVSGIALSLEQCTTSAAQSLSTWERNLGVKSHQVITGTNYHNKPEHRLCPPGMLLCLEASQQVTASPR